eukprot:888425-Pelagomonas_calceolata.AAC.11
MPSGNRGCRTGRLRLVRFLMSRCGQKEERRFALLLYPSNEEETYAVQEEKNGQHQHEGPIVRGPKHFRR